MSRVVGEGEWLVGCLVRREDDHAEKVRSLAR